MKQESHNWKRITKTISKCKSCGICKGEFAIINAWGTLTDNNELSIMGSLSGIPDCSEYKMSEALE